MNTGQRSATEEIIVYKLSNKLIRLNKHWLQKM